jgi:uncharacterized UBP type Zn finger protein
MNSKIKNLMDMGFSEDDSVKALAKCNNDVEKALNNLLGA